MGLFCQSQNYLGKDTHRNKKQAVKTIHYDWSSLTHIDIRNKYIVTVRNNLESLQETFKKDSPNEEYEKFIVHVEVAAAAECIATKPRAKLRVLWGSLAVRKKQNN